MKADRSRSPEVGGWQRWPRATARSRQEASGEVKGADTRGRH